MSYGLTLGRRCKRHIMQKTHNVEERSTLRAMPETEATVKLPPALEMAAQAGARLKPSTYQFRRTVQNLLQSNQHKIAYWLQQVAEGDEEKGIKPDPGKALDIVNKLAEFGTPRLSRQELVGDPDAPLQVAQIDARKLTTEQLRALATIELPADAVREIPSDPADEFC